MISKYLNTYFQERKKLHEQNVKGGTGISADVFAGITTSLEELKDYVNNYIEKLTSLKCTTKFSLGQGRYTPNQYLSILPPGQKTSNGTYVVFCFSQEGDGCVLGCACSVTGKEILPKDVVKRAEIVSKSKDKYQLISNNNINVHKYNNSFFNPLEITAKEVQNDPQGTEKKIIKHLSESLKLCFEKLGEEEVVMNDNIDITTLVSNFLDCCKQIGLHFPSNLAGRFIAALSAKPFVILTGLSGSGKTKIAQAFVRYITPKQYKLVAVGADWINNEHLLGYVNALDQDEYIMPDSGVLDILLEANDNPNKPYFLILDEMNLSHVERYFADFLSAMESGEDIQLYKGKERKANNKVIPQAISWPKNLYIIGTMNVDETTYMFSPKVLDRAQVIEFRVERESMKNYLENNSSAINFTNFDGQGENFASGFMNIATSAKENKKFNSEDINNPLIEIFAILAECNAEFGFRTANEVISFISNASYLMPNCSLEEIIDFAIMQKFLPKLHGSATSLRPVLIKLGQYCLKDEVVKSDDKKLSDKLPDYTFPEDNDKLKYPVSYQKIYRMEKKIESDGFASYPEA